MRTITRHEWVTVALIVVFGLVGAGLYEALGDIGELIGLLCVIPPAAYYIIFVVKVFQ